MSPLDLIVGESSAMQRIKDLVRQVAPSDVIVLITGESGVGKELIAKGIHELSPRRQGPLTVLNCGAIPEGIFESEIFGHEKGSFTSADQRRKGYFEMADGGTLFLDEIGEMPLPVQVKILRVLETNTFVRVGGSREVKVDVRIIAATNRELSDEVLKGNFRQDLYYRLNAVTINVPPLRQRPEDIPSLARRFARDFSQRNNRRTPRIEPEAMEILVRNLWRGNVRELKNFIESLIALTPGDAITAEDILHRLGSAREESRLPALAIHPHPAPDSELVYRTLLDIKHELNVLKGLVQMGFVGGYKRAMEVPYGDTEEIIPYAPVEIERRADESSNHTSEANGEHPRAPVSLEDMEKTQIKKLLTEFGGNRRLTAEALGISERTLYRKLKQYGIK